VPLRTSLQPTQGVFMADDDLIAVCTECKSQLRDSYVEKNVFYQQGGSVPCPYCGGIAVITTVGQRKGTLRRADGKRGIFRSDD